MEKRADLTENISAFAANLRVYRKALGLTQEQLAEASGLSANYVARLEIGTSTPSFAALIQLSRTLKVKASDLLATELAHAVVPSRLCETIAAILEPLSEAETEYVLSQLRNSVRFLLVHRKSE